MKRLFDFVIALALLTILSPLMLGTAIAVRLSSPGPVLFRTKRVGKRNIVFRMYKFRTMTTKTPQVATHLLKSPASHLTCIGGFLRKSSLDEFPQLFNVLKGDMSLVGPRPALFNQDDLVALRTGRGIHTLLPGLSGWAQVNGRDELPIPAKVQLDEYYLNNQSLLLDVKILLLTVLKVIRAEGVSH